MLIAAIAYLLTFRSGSAVAQTASPSREMLAAPSTRVSDQNPFSYTVMSDRTTIVVGRILSMKEPSDMERRYEIEVLLDLRNELKRGDHLEVAGSSGPTSDANGNIPLFRNGEVILIRVLKQDKQLWQFSGVHHLPFGMCSPQVLKEGQVKGLDEAFQKTLECFSDIADHKSVHDKAMVLHKRRDNFYLWALGDCLLSLEGTPEDIAVLEEEYRDGTHTVEEILWVEEIRGSRTGLLGFLLDYNKIPTRAAPYRIYEKSDLEAAGK